MRLTEFLKKFDPKPTRMTDDLLMRNYTIVLILRANFTRTAFVVGPEDLSDDEVLDLGRSQFVGKLYNDQYEILDVKRR